MATLIDLADPPPVCFGPHRPSVISDGVAWMDHALPLAEGAARLAHLALHVASPPVVKGLECVDLAIERETKALHAELEWRWALEVDTPVWPYAFEAEWRDSGGDPAVVGRYIRAHPDGGGGVAPLVRNYGEQCQPSESAGSALQSSDDPQINVPDPALPPSQ